MLSTVSASPGHIVRDGRRPSDAAAVCYHAYALLPPLLHKLMDANSMKANVY